MSQPVAPTGERKLSGESQQPQVLSTLPTLSKTEMPETAEEAHSEQKRGVVAAARIRAVISRKDIYIAYGALTLCALAINFAQYSQSVLTSYATSAFKSHAQLATASIVSGVFGMVAFAIVPKLLDNVSRISPWIFLAMVLITATSDAMMAGSNNVHTYIGANVFTGLGNTAYEMTTQVYIAETTNIVSRAFWNVAFDTFASVASLYSGSEIGQKFLDNLGTANGWRWGYGVWCILEVVLVLPFVYILYSWTRRVKKAEASLPALPPYSGLWYQIYHEYDIVGSLLMCAAITLILVPLSLAGGVAAKWTAANIAMEVVGGVCLVLFTLWSLVSYHRPASWFEAPRFPLIPWHILLNRSVGSMFIINLFDFMSYATTSIYLSTYLQVAVRTSAAQATQIDNTIRIVFQVVAICTGALMMFWTPLCTKLGLGPRLFHTRYPIIIGIPICTLSMGLCIYFAESTASAAVAQFVVARALYGLGRGMFQTTSQVAVQAAAKRGELTIATGLFYLGMSLGGSIGKACAAAIWTQKLPAALIAHLPADSRSLVGSIYGDIKVAIKYDPSTEIGAGIHLAYKETMKTIFIASTCMQIPMLICMWFVRSIKLTKDEQVVHGGKRLALAQNQNGTAPPDPNLNINAQDEKRANTDSDRDSDNGNDNLSASEVELEQHKRQQAAEQAQAQAQVRPDTSKA